MTTKPIRWSHSSLKLYEQCPRQYHEKNVLKLHPFTETEATRYGTQVHEALEHYVRDGKPIPPEYAAFKPIVDALLSKPGRKLAEHEMALTVDLQPCEWNSPDAWARGIADILIVDDDGLKAWVGDWKTGNNKYPDRDQLVLMSLMVFKHFPHIRKVNSALLFIVKGTMVKMQMSYDQADPFWWKYRERVAKIAASHATGVWNPQQSGLCKKHCPVTTCEFNGNH